MKDGDLVELCCEQGRLISIGEDDGTAGRDFPVGILCVYLGMNRERNRHRLAVNILIDGAAGWVWKDEIKPATGATAPV
jgi:hypothetical protein